MPKKTADKPNEDGVRQQRLPLVWDDSPASCPPSSPSTGKPAEPELPGLSSSSPVDEKELGGSPPTPLSEDDVTQNNDAPTSLKEPGFNEIMDEALDAPSSGASREGTLDGDIFPEVLPSEDEGDEDESDAREQWETDEEPEEDGFLSLDTDDAPEIVELTDLSLSVGQALMEARAAAGLTVTETAQRTYLSKAAIEHIETGQYDLIPTPSHCRSYIKKLCVAYDIPAAPLLERFAEEYEAMETTVRTDGLGGFVTQDRESGAMLSPRPPGTAIQTHTPRPVNFTGIAMSIIIGAFVLLVAGAIITQHLRNRRQRIEQLPADLPPVELQDFVVPQELRLDELPIPKE